MLFFRLYQNFFFYFLCFPIYNNIYPKYCQSYKKMSVNEIRDLAFENIIKGLYFLRRTVIIQ